MCLLFYNFYGDLMKVYLDLVMIINFFFDFILLLGVSILLKRSVRLLRIIYASFFGGLSILFLFMNLNIIWLNIFRLLISIIMILICFGYRDIKYTFKNILYLYFISIFLGGGLYLVNNIFSYKHDGIIFYRNGFSINIILIIILFPLILYIYIKQLKNLKNNYSNYYNVRIYLNDKYLDLIGYMDSGNSLIDPVTLKKVILIDKRKLIFNIDKYRYIPLNTVSGSSLIRCIKIDKVVINDNTFLDVLLGIIDNINLDGVDILLNNKMEGI